MKTTFIFLFITYLNVLTLPVKYCSDLSDVESRSLTLYPDFTFSYVYSFGYHMKNAKGIWQKNGRQLILNSHFKGIDNIPMTVKESHFANNDSLLFIIKCNDIEEAESIHFSIILDEKIVSVSNKMVQYLPNIQFSKFQIKVHIDSKNTTPFILHEDLFSEVYDVKLEEANHFYIRWNICWDYFYSESIQDTLQIKGNKISWPLQKAVLYKCKARLK